MAFTGGELNVIVGTAASLGGAGIVAVFAFGNMTKQRQISERLMVDREKEHQAAIDALKDEQDRMAKEIVESYRNECKEGRETLISVIRADQDTRERHTEAMTKLTDGIQQLNLWLRNSNGHKPKTDV